MRREQPAEPVTVSVAQVRRRHHQRREDEQCQQVDECEALTRDTRRAVAITAATRAVPLAASTLAASAVAAFRVPLAVVGGLGVLAVTLVARRLVLARSRPASLAHGAVVAAGCGRLAAAAGDGGFELSETVAGDGNHLVVRVEGV